MNSLLTAVTRMLFGPNLFAASSDAIWRLSNLPFKLLPSSGISNEDGKEKLEVHILSDEETTDEQFLLTTPYYSMRVFLKNDEFQTVVFGSAYKKVDELTIELRTNLKEVYKEIQNVIENTKDQKKLVQICM